MAYECMWPPRMQAKARDETVCGNLFTGTLMGQAVVVGTTGARACQPGCSARPTHIHPTKRRRGFPARHQDSWRCHQRTTRLCGTMVPATSHFTRSWGHHAECMRQTMAIMLLASAPPAAPARQASAPRPRGCARWSS